MGIGRTGSLVEVALNAAYLLSPGFEMLACYNYTEVDSLLYYDYLRGNKI